MKKMWKSRLNLFIVLMACDVILIQIRSKTIVSLFIDKRHYRDCGD